MFTTLSDIKFLISAAPIALLIIAVVVLYLRGARYILFDSLWRLFRLKGFSDSILQKHHQDLLDVERFKVMHNLPTVQTLDQAKAAAAWAEEIELSIRTVAQGRGWVNWDSKEIQVPGPKKTLVIAVLCGVSYLTALWSLGLASHNDMLVRFKESQTWMWVEENRARPVLPWLSDHSLTPATCNARQHEIPLGLHPEEVEDLCKNFGTAELRTEIKQNVYLQRVFFGGYLVMGFAMMLMFLASLKARLEAKSLRQHIARRNIRKAEAGVKEAATL